jgi:hypothetical protein
MKRLLLSVLFAATGFTAFTLLADDAQFLTGKWSVKKVNDQGQSYSQTLEIKKDKFVFQILSAEDQVVLYAQGDVELKKVGPFNSARFYHVRGGQSSSDLQDVDEERQVAYMIDTEKDAWIVASNFDADREEKPSIDVYKRVKGGAGTSGGTLVIDEIEMADTPQSATWFFCFEANLGDAKKRYYVANKGYDKNQVTIPVALELPKAQAGQKVGFKMQLDDVDEDACSEETDNRSTGEFMVSEKGSQVYKPETNWRYTIRWHLK